jgi:hypothetical protein
MWRYPLNGRPTAFWRGDWYVGKGVASALIRHPSGQLIEVFNTHVFSSSLCFADSFSYMHRMDTAKILIYVIGRLRHGISPNFFGRQYNGERLQLGYFSQSSMGDVANV